MKKVYSKPMIFIEDFSLHTSIAAGCELDTPLPSFEELCGYPMRGAIIFVDGTQCESTPQYPPYNEVCYHNPSDLNNLFNS